MTVRTLLATLILGVSLVDLAAAGLPLIVQGNGRLAELDESGRPAWEMKWGPIHDIHLLPSGNLMVQEGPAAIAEIDRKQNKVVWRYDSARSNGNAGKTVEVHAFQPLENGRIMIAESGPARIIEIDRSGKLLAELKLKVDHPHPHTDTRLVRKLPSGNYLVCHEGDGFIREYEPSGKVVWEYEVPLFDKQKQDGHGPEAWGNKAFAALRLENGDTLIATGNGHSLLRVTPEKKIVWKLEQRDLPGIVLAWVTTLEVLPNGHYVFGNCHAGPGQPVLIELDPKEKRVIWQWDGFDQFGNNVSNTLIPAAQSLR